ncbi:MAG: hypothetical protein IJ173_11420 [Kiritimatiellae bacterium]|nr:hypothetical protein [Kiritimatiellia bacterium]
MAEGWSEGLKVGWKRRLLSGSRPWRGAGAWQKGCANGHVFGARKALFGVGRNDIILENLNEGKSRNQEHFQTAILPTIQKWRKEATS